MKYKSILALVGLMVVGTVVRATETENLGIRVLPAPKAVVIDGKIDDWDLSASLFACGDVETLRDQYAVWFSAMFDAQNLYLLARWNDETPLNNPGQTMADYGFAGDCLQFRIILQPGLPTERTSHWTCWQGRDGDDLMDIAYGKRFNEGSIKDAKKLGAKQAFLKNADGKGYVQEIAIPWSLLLKEGQSAPKAGDRFVMTIEPNFTLGQSGRVTVKDIFKAGITPDRVFTFMASQHWGDATLEPNGVVTPHPLRLSDGREFPVAMTAGLPVIDLTGLIMTKELQGFKSIAFDMPEDGYISLNLRGKDGEVARQLLNCAFYTKGKHTVKWDGLTTLNWRTPGQPVPAGDYRWEALWHKGIGLRLAGWACNAGNAPWDASPTANWGGDHGQPVACAADGEKVYLGWSGAEAGKALLACDLKGNVIWKNSRTGMAGADLIAVDGGIVYAQNWGGNLYRLEAAKGTYSAWAGGDSCDLTIKTLWGADTNKPESASGMDARGGRLFLSFTAANAILMLDGQTGKLLKPFTVAAPAAMKVITNTLVYVVSEGKSILALNPETGEVKPVITGLNNARALAVDREGRLYVGLGEPDNQVLVFGAEGRPAGKPIGRKGGRALLGKWTPDGMAFIQSLAIDAAGQLWVAEADMMPKRVSCWNPATGALVKEFFGPTTYGALGGAINPQDPTVMVGQGCEWRVDAKTGRSTCLGVITRAGMENSRFAIGANGKLYLAVATRWAFDLGEVHIFERVGDADYKLRTVVSYVDKDGKAIPPPEHGKTGAAAKTALWCDENGDGERQDNEVTLVDGLVRITGWYMGLTPDLTFYGPGQFKVTGFTACGAPKYDFAQPVKVPVSGLGSADGRFIYCNGDYGVNNGWNQCYDIASGKRVWTYPDNFVGVHGSHNACPPEVGMIRGSFGACGAAKLPKPIGNIWVIGTNIGEWHILTEDGFYLTRLFQPDPLKVQWPVEAVPGASLDNCPCGMGGEDFGGSISLTRDNRLFVQAGKTGFWNVEVTGLDRVKAMRGGKVVMTASDVRQAQQFREHYLQEAAGTPRATLHKQTPVFTGSLDADFKEAQVLAFKKQDDAAVRVAGTWDGGFLYLAWDVKDKTPWINGATEANQMYLSGDTVDFQLGTDPKADKNRGEAGPGDLRLSIGSFQGKPTAVLYRKVSAEKKPKVFSSGVIKEYVMDYVDVVSAAKVEVKVNPGSGYVVEAAIPLAALGLTPAPGLSLRGDFGVTHGDPAGSRTRLRSYWSNQAAGIVDDAVFELKLEPNNWGDLKFE